MNESGLDTSTGVIAATQEHGPALAALVAKVVAAARDMKHLEKSGQNRFQNYKYIAVEDLISEVRGPLLRQGVLFYRRACVIRSYDIRQATDENSGKIKTGTFVTLDLEFILTDGLAELSLQATSEARDSGDKALQKAETSALKYTLFQNFLLQGNEDDLDEGQPDLNVDGNGPVSSANGPAAGQGGGEQGMAGASGEAPARKAPRGRKAKPAGGTAGEKIGTETFGAVVEAYQELAEVANNPERMERFAALISGQFGIRRKEEDGSPEFEALSQKQGTAILSILLSKLEIAKKEAAA